VIHVVTEDQLATMLLNYGIAGIILLVFYKLFTMFNDSISDLRKAINEMNNNVTRMVEKMDELVRKLEKK
jgi:predicted PurR-regulated permease PerM